MSKKETTSHNEAGNALWFILIAVALLALLTVTVTRSSDSTEQTGDIERARIAGTDIMRFASAVEQAIEKLRLNGTSENDISFDGVVGLTGYTNASCTNNYCRIFNREGTGLSYKSPASEVSTQDWLFTPGNSIEGVGTDGSGASSTSDNELMMIALDIPETLCARINTELGISGIPQDSNRMDISTKYQGSFPNGEVIENMDGQRTACIEGNNDESSNNITGKYYFYHVLIAR